MLYHLVAIMDGVYTCSDMQLFCHSKYSILYGALMILVVGSGQE